MRSQRIQIRDADHRELDDVAEVIVDSYAEYGPQPGDSREALAAWAEYREELRDVSGRAASGAQTIVLTEGDDPIIGTVTYFPPGTSGEDWAPGIARVRLLGILPDFRGNGLGRLLTEECLRRARDDGAVALGLYTTTMMAFAKGMYERMGFTRVPELDYEPAPGLVVMAYRLDL